MRDHQFTIPSLHAVGPRCAHWIRRPHNRWGRSHTRPMRSNRFLCVGVLLFFAEKLELRRHVPHPVYAQRSVYGGRAWRCVAWPAMAWAWLWRGVGMARRGAAWAWPETTIGASLAALGGLNP